MCGVLSCVSRDQQMPPCGAITLLHAQNVDDTWHIDIDPKPDIAKNCNAIIFGIENQNDVAI